MKPVYCTLCLLLLLCLAACSEKPPEDGPVSVKTLNGQVYVPEFTKVEPNADFIQEACISGGKVWLAGSVSQDVETDDGNGGTFTMPISGAALFQGEASGGNFPQLDGYRSFDFLNGAAGYVTATFCWSGGDGTVWIATSVYPWDDQPSADYLQQFDTAGTELTKIDLDTLPWDEKPYRFSDMITDGDDRLYVHAGQTVSVFDRNQKLLCTLEAPASAERDSLVQLPDGQVTLLVIAPTAAENSALRVIYPENKGWGESYPLPTNCRQVYTGGGNWLFFYSIGDSLYGYNASTGEAERLLSWTGVSINSASVLCLASLENGQLLAVTNQNGRTELTVLTLMDPDTLPEVSTLTYATLYLDSNTRAEIVEFNKAHSNCRIEVRDYSEYSDDLSVRQTRLHTEILAGNIPDLLGVSDLPIQQYAKRGYLEDLLPYLDSDPNLGRDAVMEQVLNAALQDGKLYQAFPSFSILTAAGRPDLTGGRTSWTWEDLQTAMDAMPEGGTATGEQQRINVLTDFLPMTVNSLVDWDSGTVREDAVRSLLEFCSTTPLRSQEETDPYAATLDGTQLLLPLELRSLDWETILAPTAFGGACSYVGYPREDGSAGSYFRLWNGAAMTTACKDKDAAWEFLREAFVSKYPTGNYFGGLFPVNRADFERMAELSTGPLRDETGQPVEEGLTAWVILPDSSLQIPSRPLTQEEFDKFMDLYNAIDHVYDPDEDLSKIVWEEASAYLGGGKSLKDAVRLIKSRAGLYISENQS